VRDCLSVRMFYSVIDVLLASVPSGTPVPGCRRSLFCRSARAWSMPNRKLGRLSTERVTNSAGPCEISFESRVSSLAAIRARSTPGAAGISWRRAQVWQQAFLRTSRTRPSVSRVRVRLALCPGWTASCVKAGIRVSRHCSRSAGTPDASWASGGQFRNNPR
jgi:hypothetical protein